jgi:mevalonate kinase
MITVSVPGKIHLLGEHSVVYGKPALLSAIDLRLSLTIIKSDGFSCFLNDEDYTKTLSPLKNALEDAIKKGLSIKNIHPHKIIIKSEIPIGYGLGSSAAISSAYTAALLKFLKIKSGLNLIYKIAIEGEKLFHGNPSGADLEVILKGGYLWFRRESAFFKLSASVNFSKLKKIKPFVLIDSGKPQESTKEMVIKVANRYRNQKEQTEKLFNNLETLTRYLTTALHNDDEDLLMEIMKKGQKNLENLGVVSKKAKVIIRNIEKLGGVGKILGGGGIKDGTGMLLCYHKDQKKLLNFIRKNNLNYFEVNLSTEGLKINA